MGKRDRRRKRQKAKQQSTNTGVPATPERVLYPSAAEPLIELLFNDGITDEAKALCRAYWEFTQPGTWARNVAEVGPTTFVSQTVRSACQVSLLTVVCPECTAPVTVANRSEMTATRLWNDDFPREPISARAPCRGCRESAQAEAAAAAALEKQRAAAAKEKKIENASRWLANSLHTDEAPSYPTPRQALALISLADILTSSDQEAFGPPRTLKYTITGSTSGDHDLFRGMYQEHWLAATLPASLDAFSYDDDGEATGMYVNAVSWTFPRWLGPTTREAATAAREQLGDYLAEHADEVTEIVQTLEAEMAVSYLNGLLTDKYGETSIPEHRLPDAYDHALKALRNGYALEQVIAVAWSAAASSVAWGQRTPGLKPGAVASASVTNLERRIGFAKDRPVPHYDLPNSVPRPAMYGTAIRFLTERKKADDALARFKVLHQRVNSREALELDHDLADLADSAWRKFDTQKWLKDLVEGRKEQDDTPVVTFASVAPTGDLAIRTTTERQMRNEVGGMTEGLPLDGTVTLDALVPVFVDHKTHKPNPVATRMIELLGGGFGIVNGTVVFFQTPKNGRVPQDLDDEHQELIRAAHEVAKATAGTSDG
ncbi:hypothetical protein ACFT25_15710 [Streptomyces hydrogenans]|uniref:hypothetical protein n=1 Tax=Streptomyces hydrogenans TaxID=1873719 RepID=UPI003628ADC0